MLGACEFFRYPDAMMTSPETKKQRLHEAAQRALAEAEERRAQEMAESRPKEHNGPKGKEPTRFGDWERKGLAIDF